MTGKSLTKMIKSRSSRVKSQLLKRLRLLQESLQTPQLFKMVVIQARLVKLTKMIR